MTKRLILAAAAASLLAGTALAQTNMNSDPKPMNNGTMSQPAATQQTGTSDMQAEANTGITMAKSASLKVRFVTPKAADFMTSKLVGMNVYNNQNENLGEIEDLAIENGKTITGVVISVGGFLGMGEHYVIVDPATVVIDKSQNTWKAFVDTSKDTLKNAPTFKYSKAKS